MVNRVALTPRVTRLRAPNPSPMTLDGTNTYLLDGGNGQAAVIDPGPDDAVHIEGIVADANARNLKVAAVLVTHGHPDHAPGAARLHALTSAPVWAHPRARFAHDVACEDGKLIPVGDLNLRAVDAPGHALDHLVFWLSNEKVLFTGDVVIGRGTVVIAPPNGDMRTYQATLARLRRDFADARSIFGGHGERLDAPRETLDAYIAHRQARERELLTALANGSQTIPQLVAAIYRETDPVLWPAAARQVLAYLIALEREGRVRSHEAARSPSAEEQRILQPDLSRLVDAGARAVAAAELGIAAEAEPLRAYELVENAPA